MKNITKKFAAFALAFTLLGTGATAAKTFSATSDTSITASAACYHGAGQPRVTYGPWLCTFQMQRKLWPVPHTELLWQRTITYRCGSCGKVLYTVPQTEWRWS